MATRTSTEQDQGPELTHLRSAKLGLRETINIARICIDLLLVYAAWLHVWDLIAPEPALVYSQSQQEVAGTTHMARVEFRNPNSNWPISRIRAEWRTDSPSVTLNLDRNAPQALVTSPTALVRRFQTQAPLEPSENFSAFLADQRPFDLSRPSVRASVLDPRAVDESRPVPALREEAYRARQRGDSIYLIATAVLLVVFVLIFHVGTQWLQRKLL